MNAMLGNRDNYVHIYILYLLLVNSRDNDDENDKKLEISINP